MEWKVSRESLITMGWLPTGQTVNTDKQLSKHWEYSSTWAQHLTIIKPRTSYLSKTQIPYLYNENSNNLLGGLSKITLKASCNVLLTVTIQ
jgi:hypothetical protein